MMLGRMAASPLRPIAFWSLLRYRRSRLLGRSVFPAGTSDPLDLVGCMVGDESLRDALHPYVYGGRQG